MPELTGEDLTDHKNRGDINLRMAFIPLNICFSLYRTLGVNWFNDFILSTPVHDEERLSLRLETSMFC